jgi:hypothetical protein
MELFRLLGTIAVENEQANKALDETAGKAENTGKKSELSFQKIGKAALTVGKAVVGAGVTLGTAWIAAIEGSREYRTEMGKLDTAFVTNGHSSDAAKKTYQDLQAVFGETDVSVEAANHLAVMTDNEKDLQTWTDICTGVFATFGDSLPIEGLTEAANETAKVGEVTGPLADALNWAGISEDEFNDKLAKCSNEQERQRLIMETLNGTYKAASDQYKETNKDVIEANRAQERLNGAMAELGRVGEPILTAVKNAISKMVEAAVPKLESLIQKVKDARKWMKDNKNTVDAWKAALIAATVTVGSFLLVLKWGAIMKAATKAVKATRAAILLFNAALRANPIGLVVSLIAGLVAAFVYLWNNNKDFRAFWISLWEKLKSACSKAVSGIKKAFNGLKGAVKTVRDTFEGIRKAAADKIDAARESVKKAVDKIKGLFPLKVGKLFSNLKVPKISVSGGKAPFGIAGKGKLPNFNVKWNAAGAVFDRPTILDSRAGLQGVGEAGAEAIAPIDVLQGYVRQAVRAENEAVGRLLVEQTGRLIDAMRRIVPKDVLLDTGVLVGELTPAIDAGLNVRYRNAGRGNVR